MTVQSRILKDRIDIYAEQTAVNDYAERELTYRFSFYDRAQVLYASAAERATSGMESPEKTMRFKVRFHLTRYSERQLIKWRNDYYNIRGIDPDTDRRYNVLTADRIPPNSLIITPEPPIDQPNLLNAGLSSFSIDSRLNYFAALDPLPNGFIFNLGGNEAPTANSAAAIATLTAASRNYILY